MTARDANNAYDKAVARFGTGSVEMRYSAGPRQYWVAVNGKEWSPEINAAAEKELAEWDKWDMEQEA